MPDELSTEALERGRLLTWHAKTFMAHEITMAKCAACQQQFDCAMDWEEREELVAKLHRLESASADLRLLLLSGVSDLAKTGMPAAIAAMKAYACDGA